MAPPTDDPSQPPDRAPDVDGIDDFVDINGIRVIPATGLSVTADMVRRLIDEDRDRRSLDLIARR